jgi:tripeptidyl-peptidase-1
LLQLLSVEFTSKAKMLMKIVVLIALLAVVFAESTGFFKMEAMNKRDDFVLKSKAEADAPHEVIFAVKQLNLDILKREVLERSTPGNAKYQQWMTHSQVGDLITNHNGAEATINWLNKHGIKHTWMSKRKEYIKATAPISEWETLFDTKFYAWADENPNGGGKDLAFRANHYSLPVDLVPHIDAVFNTVQAPPVIPKKYHCKEGEPVRQDFRPNLRRVEEALARAEAKAGANLVTTVSYLNEYYGISSNTGNSSLGQSVFETASEYYSQDDLTQFQTTYNLPQQTALDVGGFETDNCGSKNDCYEGNLDIQYIMGVAQQTASTYWYVANSIRNNPFVGWVTAIVDESNPPQANSMSWGSIEQSQSTSVLNSFNTEAMKLGAIGVTMTISTGDDGVSNSNCACTTNSGSSQSSWTGAGSWTGEGYFPNFPATCPWVTAVGASMGAGGYPPAVGESEISCQSQLGGVITSGGGFSTYYEVPDWQSSFTSAYLDGVSTAPTSGYNKNGRAIPDMSMMGVYYQVVVGGSLVSLFGTSCSAPVTAAVVSLINAARSVKGLSSIGFINPTLYANQV